MQRLYAVKLFGPHEIWREAGEREVQRMPTGRRLSGPDGAA